MSEAYTEEQSWNEEQIRAAMERAGQKRYGESLLVADDVIAELPDPQIGPDVPVMCDYSGHDNAVFRGPDGLPSSATNIRTLIPEDKVTGWMRELVRAAAGENRVDMVAACARVEGKIAAYRRGE